MSTDRAGRRRARGPTDPSLAATGAIAAAATLIFYLGVVQPLLGTRVGDLFGARGWVPYVIAFLSLWAGVMLVEKFRRMSRQREALALDLLPAQLGDRITPANAGGFAAHLEALPAASDDTLLVSRVRRALQSFGARHDAREIVAQLETQGQSDADTIDSSYAMLRVFIWAVPILGFIGTVVGIGEAVGGFSQSVGSAVDLDVMKESIGSVTTGLSIAFDTTLLALVMSLPIMFGASAMQKREEELLFEIEDWCDAQLVHRLDDGRSVERPEERVIREAIAEEMALHHAELRSWQERLSQIGETLTAHVVGGWEKIDEQLRLRQDRQQERLSDWASARQRELVEEQATTQRGLLRDFRVALEGMAAEARRLQEEGAHRADEQLAGVERLHRRLLEEQAAAAEAQGAQRGELTAAGEQLAHTLARVRSEASEARDEATRQLERLGERVGEVSRALEGTQRRLQEGAEAQGRALRDAGERLAATLGRVDAQIGRLRELSDAQLEANVVQRDALENAQREARQRESEQRDAQHTALVRASEELSAALAALRGQAEGARRGLERDFAALAPELGSRLDAVAQELARPLRAHLAQIEALGAQLDRLAADGSGNGAAPRGGLRGLLRRR